MADGASALVRWTALLIISFLVIAWVQWVRSVGHQSIRAARDMTGLHDSAAALLAARSTASAPITPGAFRAGTVPPNERMDAAMLGTCSTCRGVVLDAGAHGAIRLHLRPEWCNRSEGYVLSVASAASATSNVYRLEPGFLVQGRLLAPSVPKLASTARATKVMERGEVGWAGGSDGPDFFIYLGDGPATWLGAPHEGTVFAEVADEESMSVAGRISLLPVPPTSPGAMHLLRIPVPLAVRPWSDPDAPMDGLDALVPRGHFPRGGDSGGNSIGGGDTGNSIGGDSGGNSNGGGGVGDSNGGGGGYVPRLAASGWSSSSPLLKVAGASVDTQALACAARCHALPHTELHGDVVKWGANNLKLDAGACCEQCLHTPRCDVWVFCGSRARCNASFGQCWLKSNPSLWSDSPGSPGKPGAATPPAIVVGVSDRWVSGTAAAAPEGHASGAGRMPPAGTDAHFALRWGGAPYGGGEARGGAGRARVALREKAAPRATARIRGWLASGHCRGGDGRGGNGGGSGGHGGATGSGRENIGGGAAGGCALLGARPPPAWWGSEAFPDGTGPASRWPHGAALVIGRLGWTSNHDSGGFKQNSFEEPSWSPGSTVGHLGGTSEAHPAGGAGRAGSPPAVSSGRADWPVAVEGGPAVVRRGCVFWLSSGGRTGDGPAFGVALADHPHLGVSRTVWADVVPEDMPQLDALAAAAGGAGVGGAGKGSPGAAAASSGLFPLTLELESLWV